jgi:hypothetical protein
MHPVVGTATPLAQGVITPIVLEFSLAGRLAELEAAAAEVDVGWICRPSQCFWVTLWRRHRKDPACLVGAHKQVVFTGDDVFFGMRLAEVRALSEENARFPRAGAEAELDSWSEEVELSVLEIRTPLSNLEACILVFHFGVPDFAYNPEQTVASECVSRLCNSDAVICEFAKKRNQRVSLLLWVHVWPQISPL